MKERAGMKHSNRPAALSGEAVAEISGTLRRLLADVFCIYVKTVQRQLLLRADDNYFSRLTAITCYAARSAALGGGRSPLAAWLLILDRGDSGRWKSGKPDCGFPLFHQPSSSELWECGNPAALAGFPRGSWKAREACLWLSSLSTAPSFPRLPRSLRFHPRRFIRLPTLAFAAPPQHGSSGCSAR
jgi:hypothetical protein